MSYRDRGSNSVGASSNRRRRATERPYLPGADRFRVCMVGGKRNPKTYCSGVTIITSTYAGVVSATRLMDIGKSGGGTNIVVKSGPGQEDSPGSVCRREIAITAYDSETSACAKKRGLVVVKRVSWSLFPS